MKNNLEYKNSHKSLTFNQLLRSDEDPPSSLVDFCDIIGLIRRIKAGNKPKTTDLTEEKRKKFAERGM